jgi:hypothetical protein
MLSHISDDLSVKLYFGNWRIRYDEHGVDLLELNSVTMWLKEQLQELGGPLPSFFKSFHVDAELTQNLYVVSLAMKCSRNIR